MNVFEHAGEKWNSDWFKTVTIEQAVKALPGKREDQVRNVWKQINGKSIRSRKEPKKED